MNFSPVLLLAAISGVLAIVSAPWALGQPWLNYVFKPATTLLLMLWAWPRGAGHPMQPWIRRALVCSLAGDVALMWPVSGFLPGLGSFMLAHLAYMVAFTRGGHRAWWWPALAFNAVVAAAVLNWLWPSIPAELQPPVLVYVVALSCMAALAAGRWQALRQDAAQAAQVSGARLAACGGLLFMLSDSLIAINKFAGPVPMDSLWVLVTYWVAQACFVSALPAPAATTTRSRPWHFAS